MKLSKSVGETNSSKYGWRGRLFAVIPLPLIVLIYYLDFLPLRADAEPESELLSEEEEKSCRTGKFIRVELGFGCIRVAWF